MRAFVAVRQLVSALPVNDITRLQDEIKELKEYVEAAFADYNDRKGETRMQLELINQAIAELQGIVFLCTFLFLCRFYDVVAVYL